MLGPRTYSKKDTDLHIHGVGKKTIFMSFAHMKARLSDFSLKHHQPFRVKYSDESKRYTVICEQGPKKCPWIVRAVPMKGSGTQWKLTNCCLTHRCAPKKIANANALNDHRQLTSEFIGQKITSMVKILLTCPIKDRKSVV